MSNALSHSPLVGHSAVLYAWVLHSTQRCLVVGSSSCRILSPLKTEVQLDWRPKVVHTFVRRAMTCFRS